jgi:hypothetical protein
MAEKLSVKALVDKAASQRKEMRRTMRVCRQAHRKFLKDVTNGAPTEGEYIKLRKSVHSALDAVRSRALSYQATLSQLENFGSDLVKETK